MIKKVLFTLLLATAVLLACNAGGQSDKKSAVSPLTPSAGADEDTSYAVGMALGADLRQQTQLYLIPLNYDAFARGFKDSMEGNEPRISLDASADLIRVAMIAAMEKQAEDNTAKEVKFFEENGKKSGINTTPSGLQYEVITQGSGQKPTALDVVSVHYEGTLLDGTVFDSSYDRGEPAEFPLNAVIAGWAEGIQLMNVGSVYRLFIPSKLAYGDQGAGNIISPNATLIFKVELLQILKE